MVFPRRRCCFLAAIPEANVAAALLLRAGFDPSRSSLEDASRTTAENARLAVELVPDRPGNRVLVTSAFHMRRAVATFCAAGWRGILPYPVDFRTAPGFRASPGLPENLGLLTLFLHEVLGLAVYRASGLAADPLPEGCLAG
ncbi:YdcF family protein [Rhodovulum sp. YEN HP10]|uniref:YdcF family protein n=1 Tax=Rhodovulum sp. HP10 TaxID=3387397 RepID=UPI0039E0AD05